MINPVNMKFAPFIIFHDCNDGLMLSKIDSALKVLKKKNNAN